MASIHSGQFDSQEN